MFPCVEQMQVFIRNSQGVAKQCLAAHVEQLRAAAQGISLSAQLGEGDGGKGTPGKEQGSSIEGVSTSLGKRRISLLWF